MPEALALSGAELDYAIEAFELVLADYEDDYWEVSVHDSPEDWVAMRTWYSGVAGIYKRATGRRFRGVRAEWDGDGPHDLPGMQAGDPDEVTEGG